MSDILKIGLVQYSPIWENPSGSIDKINTLLMDLPDDVKVLIFPELTLTGFTSNSEKLSEDIDGISTLFYINLAKKFKIDIFGGLIENEKEQYFNTLLHIDPTGLIKARYRKIHPFSFAGEDKHFSSSKEIVITKIGEHKIGLSVCYDLRFPELYRFYAKEKVELIINIANWPQKRIEHWKLLNNARALENLCYFIGVNRTGYDPLNNYNGCSIVSNPLGIPLFDYIEEEKIIITEIDFSELHKIRESYHFLDDIKLL